MATYLRTEAKLSKLGYVSQRRKIAQAPQKRQWKQASHRGDQRSLRVGQKHRREEVEEVLEYIGASRCEWVAKSFKASRARKCGHRPSERIALEKPRVNTDITSSCYMSFPSLERQRPTIHHERLHDEPFPARNIFLAWKKTASPLNACAHSVIWRGSLSNSYLSSRG